MAEHADAYRDWTYFLIRAMFAFCVAGVGVGIWAMTPWFPWK